MSKEYIEREAVVAFLENMAASRYLIQCFESKERFPAADVAPVVHGEWRRYQDKWYCRRVCTNCEMPSPYNQWGKEQLTKYCPNCGAEMLEGSLK